MSSLLSVVFNIELSLIIASVTSFILAFLLFLINVPNTEYSRKLAKTKNTIAMGYLASSVIFYLCLRHSGIDNYEVFSSLMVFVVTALSSAVLSFSLTNLLEDGDNDKFYINVAAIAIVSYVLMKAFWMPAGVTRTAIIALSIVLFVVNCIIHIIVFHRTYKRSLKKIEQYYDEDQDHKIKWIRFCYVIMMLTQMFILVYMLLPRGFMKIYTLWYVLFMLYFTANFISFLGSHKLLLDAFAYKTLSGQEIMERIERRKKYRQDKEGVAEQTELTDPQLMRIERSLQKWVKEKRFREYDKTREQIARELNTTKEMLHLYFTTKVGVDFKTWRTGLRIEEAKRLLLENPEMSTNIIAELSGFSDRSNFHRQFTKIVGCSPKQWRETNGKSE
ncbi:MAG: AraC family transcriptional regulator [Bacteroidales bacterium]|nr:AraC family transcriptional regulator [Bacteroidales bacterium]